MISNLFYRKSLRIAVAVTVWAGGFPLCFAVIAKFFRDHLACLCIRPHLDLSAAALFQYRGGADSPLSQASQWKTSHTFLLIA